MSEKMKIIEKVVKLLALADGTNHSEEAQSAKEMAAALMAKYQIKTAELHKNEDYQKKFNEVNRKKPIPYDTMLQAFLAKYNGVAILIHKASAWNKGGHSYIGREADIQCFEYMLAVVLQQRKAAYAKYLKGFKAEYGRRPTSKGREDWYYSFAYGIEDKLKELKAMENSKVQEYGLVPVDGASQAMAWYKKDNKVGKAGKTRSIQLNPDGYSSGKNTSIHKGVETQGKVRKLT